MCENAVMLKPCGSPFQHPYPIRTQPSKQTGSRVHVRDDNEKRGFTLIELLVVVLIIGILAAVALPQYQVAVNKSRLMKGVVLARPYLEAEEVYKIANGAYTHRMAELDLGCPFSSYREEDGTGISICSDGRGHSLMLSKSYLKYSFVKNYQSIVGFDWNYSTRILSCFSAVEAGKKACKSLGGVEQENGRFDIQM